MEKRRCHKLTTSLSLSVSTPMSSYHVSIRRLADSFKTTLELWKLLEAKPTNDMNLNYEILVGYSNRPVLILNLSRQFNQPDKN